MTNETDNSAISADNCDELRASVNRLELATRIARGIPEDGSVQPLSGLFLNRVSSATGLVHGVAHPSFCVIAQGSKEVQLGDERYRYDPYRYLLSTVELPVVSQVIDATPDRPYLSLRLDLDPSVVVSVLLEAGVPAPRSDAQSARAVNVSMLSGELLDASVRLVRLLDSPPAEARILMPLITREIVFRLLAGEQSARLRHIAVLGGHTERIGRAIQRLRVDLNKPLRVDSFAREFGMSASAFHEHFKAVTAMSPLQFQKQLRLQEARRLMLGEDLDAASAAYRVGYEDASHFSREYKRLFGAPPMRDVERLRGTAIASS